MTFSAYLGQRDPTTCLIPHSATPTEWASTTPTTYRVPAKTWPAQTSRIPIYSTWQWSASRSKLMAAKMLASTPVAHGRICSLATTNKTTFRWPWRMRPESDRMLQPEALHALPLPNWHQRPLQRWLGCRWLSVLGFLSLSKPIRHTLVCQINELVCMFYFIFIEMNEWRAWQCGIEFWSAYILIPDGFPAIRRSNNSVVKVKYYLNDRGLLVQLISEYKTLID